MRKAAIGLLVVVIFMLTACNNNKISNSSKTAQKKPVVQGKELYLTKQSSTPSDTRGLILKNIGNPLDVDELDTGLMDLSQEHFSPQDYYLQVGKYINKANLNEWVNRKSKSNPNGLNPEIPGNKDSLQLEKAYPPILSYVLEQDYLDKSGKTAGVSIAVALDKTVQVSYTDAQGLVYSDSVTVGDSAFTQEGENIGESIIKQLRNKHIVPNVPIFLTLYQTADTDKSIVPGYFFEKAFVDTGEGSIDSWSGVDRKYYPFPDSSTSTLDKGTSDMFQNLKDDFGTNFPDANYTMVGEGLYVDKQLTNLEIDIKVPGADRPLVEAMTQYLASELQNKALPDYIPISIRLMDIDDEKALITWDPEKESIGTYIY
ncbi:CamS family sex pheromone protein [Heyndrickxia acidicola]|uniref:CamS family sex pheromone protein n=1 Tax=Heyndrickxia acidicola TaxID=209389 RepID=A0ABU6MMT4_9BACI|nr:CamS family sex pheromone protein [Heyndrickxia acidicola]MED1204512.1 CamS family sex pheromone protein [Heyndrickxia acidicola]